MNIREIYKPVRADHIDWPIEYIEEDIERQNIRLDVDYQRGHVWTREQQERFVGYLLQGGPSPPIYINCINYEEEGYKEVVDGKQRISAVLEWLRGNISATLNDGRQIRHSDFTDHGLYPITLPLRRVFLNRKETLEFYILLNSAGTIHESSEIERVRTLLRDAAE